MGLTLDYGFTFPQRINSAGFFEFTNDIQVLVRSSILQILGTYLGERYMEPEFGSRLPELLFEPIDDIAVGLARVYTIDAIKRWEPRVKLNDVVTTIVPDQGILNIFAAYVIINQNLEDNLTLTLPRRNT